MAFPSPSSPTDTNTLFEDKVLYYIPSFYLYGSSLLKSLGELSSTSWFSFAVLMQIKIEFNGSIL